MSDLCQCGCGQEVTINQNTNMPNKYIRGHHMKLRRGESHPNFGKTWTTEHKQKISESEKGKKLTEEHKRKIGEAHRGKKRKAFTEEALKNMSNAQKGKHHSEEAKRKMSITATGKRLSEETKKKISESKKGIPAAERTEEWCNNLSESKMDEKNPAWNGGTSFLPYCHKFNNKLKELFRNRNGHTCQICGIKENDRKHSVHHIHYDKENCYPNSITLCNSCHLKSNNNRNYWECFYMNKLNDRNLLCWSALNNEILILKEVTNLNDLEMVK